MPTLTKTPWFGGISLLLAAALPLGAQAQDAEARGLEIATEADARDTGWGDSVVDLTMILRNKNGDESIREMRSRALEVADDGDKSICLLYTSPSPRD